jgi:hypothetical protein
VKIRTFGPVDERSLGLAAHSGSIRVKRRLRPLGVAMAGRDEYDPYTD